MAGVPEKVLNWLYSVLTSEYSDVNRTYHDAAEALAHYPSLSPRTEIYTYENGASALLLLLSGTLPVTFRGATYGFPVAIWVPHSYPREPPMVYITPSPDMVVRPGQHVSGDGRVYHPYLAQWAKYWDKSDLFNFLAVLRGVFAKEPPVRSKQQQPQPAPQAPPPVPPPPADWRRSIQGPLGASASPGPSSQSPVPPPKPPKPHEQNMPTSQSPADRYSRAPPLPSQQPHSQPPYRQPQGNNHGMPPGWQQSRQMPQQQVPNRQGSLDSSPATPSSSHQRPQVQAQHYASQQYGPGSPVSPITPDQPRAAVPYPPQGPRAQQPVYTSQAQQPSSQPQYSRPPQPPQPYQQPPPQAYPPQQQPRAPKPPINLLDDSLTVTLPSQHHPHPALPVPPVPPNPEKDALLHALSRTLVAHLRTTLTATTSALAPLHAQHAALHTASTHLHAELSSLQHLAATLAANESTLRTAMLDADRAIARARSRAAPDVDDVLVAPSVVGGQLYALAAEERAIAETMFVLGRALDRGRVAPDVFVKHTRGLAREQFLKKALVRKIARGMALDEYCIR
ncbi:Suppressor protein stp22 of temperature-sensitive alpha-factor receptor and arginine permease [Coniothyrium glycines]